MSTLEQRGIFEEIYLRYLKCLRDYPALAAAYGPPHGPDFGIDWEELFMLQERIAEDFNRSNQGETI